jgi:hypothetical protein
LSRSATEEWRRQEVRNWIYACVVLSEDVLGGLEE